jgi:hypothetical protein
MKRLAIVLLALVGAGCGGSSAGAISGAMCTHPSYLDDAGASGCLVARALVACSSGGIDSECISDTLTCGGSDPGSCTNKCHGNEYALSCGGIGPGSTSAAGPPPECRAGLATPGASYSIVALVSSRRGGP